MADKSYLDQIPANETDSQPASTSAALAPEAAPKQSYLDEIPNANAADTSQLDADVFNVPGAPDQQKFNDIIRTYAALGIDPNIYGEFEPAIKSQIKQDPKATARMEAVAGRLNRHYTRNAQGDVVAPEGVTEFEKSRLWISDVMGVNRKLELDRTDTPTLEKTALRLGLDVERGAIQALQGIYAGIAWLTESDSYRQAADQLEFLAKDMQPVDPNFGDEVLTGVGQIATYFVPGLGVGRGVGAFMSAAPRVAGIVGAGTMASMEGMSEAGFVWQEVYKSTDGNREEADAAATATFAWNMPLLFVTNKLGIFAESGSPLRRFLISGALEGTQEVGQEFISTGAKGEDITALLEGENLKGLATAFGVGFITGGGLGAVQWLHTKQAVDDITRAGSDPRTVESIAQATGVAPDAVKASIDALAKNEGLPQSDNDRAVLGGVYAAKEGIITQDERDTQTILDALDTPEADVTPQTIEDALASGATDEQIADALLGKTAEKVGITAEKVGKTEGVVSTGQPAQFTQTAEQQVEVTQEGIAETAPEAVKQANQQAIDAALAPAVEQPTALEMEAVAPREIEPEAQVPQELAEIGLKPYDLTEDGEIPTEMAGRIQSVLDRVAQGDTEAVREITQIYKDTLDSGLLSGIGWKMATGNGQYAHEILFDLDDFKQYNTNYGYVEADRILTDFGMAMRRIVSKISPEAATSRPMGDEFKIALNDPTDVQEIIEALTDFTNGYRIDLRNKKTGEIVKDVTIGFSFGDGVFGDKNTIEKALEADKYRRFKDGLRKDPRGEDRRIADEVRALREKLRLGDNNARTARDVRENRRSAERLLGLEEGALDLDNEVTLAPILARLRESIKSPATAMSDILALGRSAWAEGKTRLSDFTARMQQVLGDMYASFKDVVRRAWGIINNREGSATLWPGVEVNDEGDPQINVQQRLADLAKFVASAEGGGRVFGTEGEFVGAYGSTFPDFMRDMGWRKDRVLPALEHAVKGEPLTENQREYVVAALAQVQRDWVRSIMNTEGQFIDFTETHSADEIHDIATEGIEAFVKTLKMFKPSMEAVLKSELRAERAAAFEANKKIDRVTRELAIKTSEIWNLQDALESEQVEGEESAKRIRETIKEAGKRLKQAIREEGQRRVPTVAQAQRASMDIFTELTAEEAAQVRAAIVEQLAIARTARSQGRTLEAQAARERIADIRQEARDKASARRVLSSTKALIKRLKKYKGNNIAVEYQKKIYEVVSGIDLAKPSDKTLTKLRDLQEWIAAEPQATLVISPDRIAQLKRLSQRPLAEFTIVELNELKRTLKDLVNIGRLQAEMKEVYDAEIRAKEIEKAKGSFVNLDVTKPGEEATPLDAIREARTAASLMAKYAARAADTIDGVKMYKGYGAQTVKEMSRHVTYANVMGNALIDQTMEKIATATEGIEVDEKWQAQIAAHIRILEGSPEAADKIIEGKLGGELAPLTKEQKAVLDILHEATNRYSNEVATIYEATTGRMFPWREYYVLPLFYEADVFNLKPEDVLMDGQRDPGHLSESVKNASTQERTGTTARVPRTDVFDIFAQHIRAQMWYMHLQPVIYTKSKIILSDDVTTHMGRIASEWWATYIDIVARRGWGEGAKLNTFTKFLEKGRNNVTSALILYKVTTVAKQPLAVMQAAAYALQNHGPRAMWDIVDETAKSWIATDYAEIANGDSWALRDRAYTMGEVAIQDALEKNNKLKGSYAKWQKWGSAGIQWTDIKTAAGAREAFKKILTREGYEGDIDAEADFLMQHTQATANIALRPTLYGQSVYLRVLGTLQSFAINFYDMAWHDIILTSAKNPSFRRIFYSIMTMFLMYLSDYGEDVIDRAYYKIRTGKDLPPRANEALEFAALVPKSLPFFGPAIEQGLTGGPGMRPSPLLSMTKRPFERTFKVVEHISDGDARKIALDAVAITEAVVSVLRGTAGTAQIADVAEYMLKEKK